MIGHIDWINRQDAKVAKKEALPWSTT